MEEEGNLELVRGVELGLGEVMGGYGIGVVEGKDGEEIIGAGKSSGLVVGVGEGELLLGWDGSGMVS